MTMARVSFSFLLRIHCFVVGLMLSSFLTVSAVADLFPKAWQSQHFLDHPLVGQHFTGRGQKVAEALVLERLKNSSFLFLGETHDNPDHHEIQAGIIGAIAAGDARSIVFEMVPRRLQDKLDGATSENLNSLETELEWEERGWYSWDIYRGIFDVALERGHRLKAGNLDRDRVRSVSKSGLTALTEGERKRFALSSNLPKEAQDSLAAELEESHCGMIPKTAVPAMARVQRAVDGSLADAMISGDDGHGAVLIAGNGHVRKDRGVPFVLKRLMPGAKSLAVGLIEVSPEAKTFADYPLKNEQAEPLYDYVIFTPKYDITDHCALMREQFKKKKPDDKEEQN